MNFNVYSSFIFFHYEEEEVNSEKCFETKLFRATGKDKKQSSRASSGARFGLSLPGLNAWGVFKRNLKIEL